jgi:hypothetical protein
MQEIEEHAEHGRIIEELCFFMCESLKEHEMVQTNYVFNFFVGLLLTYLEATVSQLVIHLLAFLNILTGTDGVQTRCTSAKCLLSTLKV